MVPPRTFLPLWHCTKTWWTSSETNHTYPQSWIHLTQVSTPHQSYPNSQSSRITTAPSNGHSHGVINKWIVAGFLFTVSEIHWLLQVYGLSVMSIKCFSFRIFRCSWWIVRHENLWIGPWYIVDQAGIDTSAFCSETSKSHSFEMGWLDPGVEMSWELPVLWARPVVEASRWQGLTCGWSQIRPWVNINQLMMEKFTNKL